MSIWRYILHIFRIHSWGYYIQPNLKQHRICGICFKEQEWYVMGDFDRTSFWKDIK